MIFITINQFALIFLNFFNSILKLTIHSYSFIILNLLINFLFFELEFIFLLLVLIFLFPNFPILIA